MKRIFALAAIVALLGLASAASASNQAQSTQQFCANGVTQTFTPTNDVSYSIHVQFYTLSAAAGGYWQTLADGDDHGVTDPAYLWLLDRDERGFPDDVVIQSTMPKFGSHWTWHAVSAGVCAKAGPFVQVNGGYLGYSDGSPDVETFGTYEDGVALMAGAKGTARFTPYCSTFYVNPANPMAMYGKFYVIALLPVGMVSTRHVIGADGTDNGIQPDLKKVPGFCEEFVQA